MAVVIPFAPRAASAPRRDGADSASCAILFFTGIRYERHQEPEPLLMKPRVARPKRLLRKNTVQRARPPA